MQKKTKKVNPFFAYMVVILGCISYALIKYTIISKIREYNEYRYKAKCRKHILNQLQLFNDSRHDITFFKYR